MVNDEDFIGIFDNNVPVDLCNELVKWFDWCSDNGFTANNMGTLNSNFKEDEAVVIPSVHSLSIPEGVVTKYWECLNICLDNYVEKYSSLKTLELSSYVFKIHKILGGQGYHVWHYETDGDPYVYQRILAWITYLKAPEEGGETEFLYQSKRIKPAAGTTLIWPAHFTHLHRGNPPLKGEKYYITGWFERSLT